MNYARNVEEYVGKYVIAQLKNRDTYIKELEQFRLENTCA